MSKSPLKAILLSLLYCVALPFPTAAAPMSFELVSYGGNCGGCEAIVGSGDIMQDSANVLEEFLRKEKFSHGGHLVLNSGGGSLVGGLSLGRVIRQHGMSTEIGEVRSQPGTWEKERPHDGGCYSACSYAFLGGVSREVSIGSKFGVHQFYSELAMRDPSKPVFNALDVSNNQVTNGVILDYIVSMGVEPRVASIAAATPPTGMRVLSVKELIELKVIWSPKEFQPWQIEAYKNGIVAFSKTRDGTQTLTVYCSSKANARFALLHTDFPSDQPVKERGKIESKYKFKFLGITIPSLIWNVSTDGFNEDSIIALPPQFRMPDITAPMEYTLNNINDAPHSAHYSIFFNPAGAEVSVGLAFRNCI